MRPLLCLVGRQAISAAKDVYWASPSLVFKMSMLFVWPMLFVVCEHDKSDSSMPPPRGDFLKSLDLQIPHRKISEQHLPHLEEVALSLQRSEMLAEGAEHRIPT